MKSEGCRKRAEVQQLLNQKRKIAKSRLTKYSLTAYKIIYSSQKNYFQALKINYQALGINYQALGINYQALKIYSQTLKITFAGILECFH